MKVFNKRGAATLPVDNSVSGGAGATTQKPYRLWRGLLFGFCLFIAYDAIQFAIVTVTAPFTAGWDEVFLQLAVRIPIGLPVYFMLRKKYFKTPKQKINLFPMLLFLGLNLIMDVPVQIVWRGIGAADPVSPMGIALFILNGYLLAPFTEEIIFRGILFTLSRRKMDFAPALIVNMAMFTLAHIGDAKNTFMAMSLTLIACSLYEITGHIRYGMIVHFLVNNSAWPILTLGLTFPVALRIPVTVLAVVLSITVAVKRDSLAKFIVKKTETLDTPYG